VYELKKKRLAKFSSVIVLLVIVIAAIFYFRTLLDPTDWSTHTTNPTFTPTVQPTPNSNEQTPGPTSPTSNPTTTLEAPKTLYTLEVIIIGNGTSDPAAGMHNYPSDTAITLTAKPSEGWKFSAWNNTNNDSANPTTVTLTSNRTIILYLTAPYQVYGLDFGPYVEAGQDPNSGTNLTQSQITTLLTTVKPYTQWVRTYGTTHGLETVGPIAHALNIKVAVEAWIGTDQTANQQEVANLISIANAGNADLLIVGSEVLLRNDVTDTQLISYINTVKQAVPGIPVTTADTYSELLSHPAVMNACTVIMPNYYPFWDGISVDSAIYKLNIENQQIIAAAGVKPIVIGESGWPSAGNTVGNAVPSADNAQSYFVNFVSWAKATNTPYFYFEAFDEAWKTNEGLVGPHWGLWDNNGTLKTGMDRTFNGETVPDNWDSVVVGGSGTPTISFTYVPPVGSFDNLQGSVLHVNPSDYRVVVYIKVSGAWWIKPYSASPQTTINIDGTWTCDITTGGIDEQATTIAAYLTTKTYSPPLLAGSGSLPTELDSNSVAKISVIR
jgi:exo-beta-1,3-glucanase (GH17 family)